MADPSMYGKRSVLELHLDEHPELQERPDLDVSSDLRWYRQHLSGLSDL